jgi:hypothetical protein
VSALWSGSGAQLTIGLTKSGLSFAKEPVKNGSGLKGVRFFRRWNDSTIFDDIALAEAIN